MSNQNVNEHEKSSSSSYLSLSLSLSLSLFAGGSFYKLYTQKTALSQTHLNGERIKKKLSERVHRDVTGIVMHRDLFSAYLSRYINENGELSLQDAASQYPGTEPKRERERERERERGGSRKELFMGDVPKSNAAVSNIDISS